MAELPVLPLKTDALLADTTHMSAEEMGAYCRILFVMWRHGAKLPDSPVELARIAGISLVRWRKISEPVMRPLICAGGFISQKRLTSTWMDVQERRQKNSSAGLNGGLSKWGTSPIESNRATRSERLSEARLKGRHTKAEWSRLIELCGSRCVKCGRAETIVKDHITPIYQGGSDGIENLQPLCVPCNSSKGPDCTDHRPDAWHDAWRKPSNGHAVLLPSMTPCNQNQISKKESFLPPAPLKNEGEQKPPASGRATALPVGAPARPPDTEPAEAKGLSEKAPVMASRSMLDAIYAARKAARTSEET